ncbi:CRISPR-associated endoribonuclease Cas6 [Thermodesulfovibrio hydrogeniphilus]
MRLKIDFSVNQLPILYRHRFMALIKEALLKSDESYKEKLYPDKKSEFSKVTKPFCFSVLLPAKRRAEKQLIKIDNDFAVEDTVYFFEDNSNISFFVSSCDNKFIIHLYNGLLKIGQFQLFDNGIITRQRIHYIREKPIKAENIAFKTMSPILIEDKDENPILPLDNLEEFNFHFNSIHDRILKDIRDYGLKRELKFSPISIKKQVVKHTLKDFRQQTGKPVMMLTCFSGSFILEGEPEDLKILYQIGIGLRTGQGFGMIDVC